MNDSDTIPMDWVEGPDETTIWLWTDSPDPLTVRMKREKWERFREQVEECDETVPERVTKLITADLETVGGYLGEE